MFSNTTIIGRLTRDPESQYTPSGIQYAKFSVAVDRDFKDKESGERETDFFECTAWRNAAEFVTQYVEKGRLVVVMGRMQSRKYTGDDGQSKTFWQLNVEKVSALDRPKNENGDLPKREARQKATDSKKKAAPPPANDNDEADPFAEE